MLRRNPTRGGFRIGIGVWIRRALVGIKTGRLRRSRHLGEARREDGKEERDVLRLTALPLELEVPFVEGRATV